MGAFPQAPASARERFPLTQPKLSWRIVKGILRKNLRGFLGFSWDCLRLSQCSVR